MLYIIYSWLFLDHKKSFIYNIGYYKSYFHILFLTVNVKYDLIVQIHYFGTIWFMELLYFMSIYVHQRKTKLTIQIDFSNHHHNWTLQKNIFRVLQFAKSCYDTLVLELITTFLPTSSLSIIFISRGFIIQSTIYIISIDIYHICSSHSTHLRGLLKVNPIHCYSGASGGFNLSCWVVDTLS